MTKAAFLMAYLLVTLFFFPLPLKAQINPDLTFHANRTSVGAGNRFTLELEISGTSREPVDLYIAARLPSENFLFFTQNPFTPFVPDPTPYRQNFDVTNDIIRIIDITATEELEGEYLFIAAFIRARRPADIFNVVGNIEQIEIRITYESVPDETGRPEEVDFSGRYFIRYYPYDVRIIRNTTSFSNNEILSLFLREVPFVESGFEANGRFEHEGTTLRWIDEETGRIDIGTISGDRFTFSEIEYILVDSCGITFTAIESGSISNNIIDGEVRVIIDPGGSGCRERGVIEYIIPFNGQKI